MLTINKDKGEWVMENYFYKCESCGFVHLIPAYWSSFNPDEELEFAHINRQTGKDCINNKLILMPLEGEN